jgi:hypothetical protein
LWQIAKTIVGGKRCLTRLRGSRILGQNKLFLLQQK